MVSCLERAMNRTTTNRPSTYMYNYTQEGIFCQISLKEILNLFVGEAFDSNLCGLPYLFNTN